MNNPKNDNYLLKALKATEAAAIASYSLMGKGDEKAADQLAVSAMRAALNQMHIQGTVVIGEGERDEAPMLYIGEKVGSGAGPEIDVALDPLEGTTILATGGSGALSVLALTHKGGFLHAPDVYMEKIAIGFDFPEALLDLDNSPAVNLKNIARAKKCATSDLTTIILNRSRHQELIAKVREAGARVQLIGDGDVAGIIETTIPGKADVYMGIGGAPEGVLAAAGLLTTGGQMRGRLLWETPEQKTRAQAMGIMDLARQYDLKDLATGDVIFIATGVTDGSMLRGVRFEAGKVTTHSLVMCARNSSIKKIETTIVIP